jgi:uncharacterized membrane protein
MAEQVEVPVTAQVASRTLKWLLTLGGLVGLYASAQLTIDKINLLSDENYVPSCSINEVLACGNIISTDQASAFGFPNSLIGIASFSVLTTIGVVLLAKAQLPRWVFLGVLAGSFLGTVFVSWLAYQSVFVIGALCPWCMVVWGMTVPIFGLTLRDLLKTSSNMTLRAFEPVAGVFVLGWFVAVGALIAIWQYL